MGLILLVKYFDYFMKKIEATSDSVISWHSHSLPAWIMRSDRWRHDEFIEC